MYYVYILKLKNNKFYTGYTNNLKKRFQEHNSGQVSSTHNFRPIILVWFCAFINKKSAKNYELYLKSSSGFAFRNKHLL